MRIWSNDCSVETSPDKIGVPLKSSLWCSLDGPVVEPASLSQLREALAVDLKAGVLVGRKVMLLRFRVEIKT